MPPHGAPLSSAVPAKALILLGMFLILLGFAAPLFQQAPSVSGEGGTWNLATLWYGPHTYLISLLEVVPLVGAVIEGFLFILGVAKSSHSFRWLVIWAVWAALGLFMLLTPTAFGLSFSDFPYVVAHVESGVWIMLAGYACVCAGAGVIAMSARQ